MVIKHFTLQGPPKIYQIWIFGLKINEHLATLFSVSSLMDLDHSSTLKRLKKELTIKSLNSIEIISAYLSDLCRMKAELPVADSCGEVVFKAGKVLFMFTNCVFVSRDIIFSCILNNNFAKWQKYFYLK
jgi:hypothetical protein